MIKSPRPRSPRWISTSIPQTEWGSTLALYSSAEYHVNNLVSPVLFQEGLSLIPDNAVVVEIAPHALLQVSDKDCNEFLSPTGDTFFFFFEQHSNWITLTSSPGHSEAQPQAHLFHFALVEERTCQQLGVLSFSHRQDLHEWVSTDLVILQNIIKAIIVSYIYFFLVCFVVLILTVSSCIQLSSTLFQWGPPSSLLLSSGTILRAGMCLRWRISQQDLEAPPQPLCTTLVNII